MTTRRLSTLTLVAGILSAAGCGSEPAGNGTGASGSGGSSNTAGTHGGDFITIDLAWLNWQLKGDETATGKGLVVGSSCPYCKDAAWEMKSQNIQ